mmetsp:Transcript_20982/g.41139  ORF Transcript_20982/g.41139 Transcript_20982/m.41139 type:complete len:241 (+) Transcript_20982:302-1024(+)
MHSMHAACSSAQGPSKEGGGTCRPLFCLCCSCCCSRAAARSASLGMLRRMPSSSAVATFSCLERAAKCLRSASRRSRSTRSASASCAAMPASARLFCVAEDPEDPAVPGVPSSSSPGSGSPWSLRTSSGEKTMLKPRSSSGTSERSWSCSSSSSSWISLSPSASSSRGAWSCGTEPEPSEPRPSSSPLLDEELPIALCWGGTGPTGEEGWPGRRYGRLQPRGGLTGEACRRSAREPPSNW